MTSFDQLETNHRIAEKQYTAALQTFERTCLNAESKKIYLAPLVKPLPHESWPSHRLLVTYRGRSPRPRPIGQ